MAEGESIVIGVPAEPDARDKGDSLECAVCLQTCIHPAQLPCGHIFCFLCIKGIANQSKKCAMCRQEIPRDFIDHPNLLRSEFVDETSANFDGTYQWFYEGRNGWWQYDERTSKELEASYKGGERICELLIAGFLYVADLEAMLQIRRNDPSRRRRIKRDLANIPKKGIAGLRTDSEQQNQEQESQHPESLITNTIENPPPPRIESNTANGITSNTAQSSGGSQRESSEQDQVEGIIERIDALRLEDELVCQYYLNM